jgi:hypothetical protein
VFWRVPDVAFRRVATGLAIAYVLLSGAAATRARKQLIEAEAFSRRLPAIEALAVSEGFGGVYPIVTLEPLLIQLYGPTSRVISMPSLSSEHLTEGALYLEQDHYKSGVDRRRYAVAFQALARHRHVELQRGEGWAVWLISRSTSE